VLSHETAAELAGLLDEPADLVHVTLPASRRILGWSGVRCHLSVPHPRARGRSRWRAEVATALADIATGCQSTLELAYLRRVERPHRLPAARRQASRRRRGGRWHDDVCYEEYRTLIELDGPAYHAAEATVRDKRRDNAAVAAGLTVLRYGVGDVVGQPCAVAGQIAAVLRRNGWRGRPRRCRPGCPAGGPAGGPGPA
jgi:very-short-patch-repair endonuclease